MTQVTLISYSKPVYNLQAQGIVTITDLIAYCARVSNPENQLNQQTNERLIKYLIKNKHWSPFEIASVTLEVKTTRDIVRQILRHRSFSFQEFSQRYAAVTNFGDYREARLQDPKNRQNSIDTDNKELAGYWNSWQHNVQEVATQAYKWALANGIAKEQARCVLPEGLTMSTLYMAGTLRSWIHYIQLRSANGTQKEHQEVALKCAAVIQEIFPLIKDITGNE